MPELPDIAIYIEALERRIVGARLEGVKLKSPFLLRSIDPPLGEAIGGKVRELRRVGKRIAISLDNGVWLVLHLMIAGRLEWDNKKPAQATFTFDCGTLLSGIGNAYSDDILWAAQLSPIAQMQKLTGEDMARLFTATTECLRTWIDRLRAEMGNGFPTKVTAFRPEMAMHRKLSTLWRTSAAHSLWGQ